jgi:glutamine synthetase
MAAGSIASMPDRDVNPPPGRLTLDELRARIEAGSIDTVINAICDMQGRLVGKRVTGWYLRDHAASHGTHFCTYLLGNDMEMNTPDGYPLMSWETGYGDYLARPDWNTLRVIPWLERTALVLADAVDESSGNLVPVAPRTILRTQIERCESLGFRPRLSMELEYYLLDDSYREAREKGYRDLRASGWYSEDYHILQGTKHESIHGRIRNDLTSAGVPIEGSKGEDAGGQHEVNIHYADALEAADCAALLKHGAKEIAFLEGRSITFMPKPDQQWTGSSGHVHISLWDPEGDHNLFSDGGDSMSDVMRWFLGGLIRYTRELALFFAPNVNSYKRFAATSWAPVNILWARDNRTVGYRIVGRDDALRVECRFPGGDANPYLAASFLLAAGLAGIENRIEPPSAHQGSGYTAESANRVPRALYEAIDEWRDSALARSAFGDLVADHYLNAALVEQDAFDQAVTDWERERYFERG